MLLSYFFVILVHKIPSENSKYLCEGFKSNQVRFKATISVLPGQFITLPMSQGSAKCCNVCSGSYKFKQFIKRKQKKKILIKQ